MSNINTKIRFDLSVRYMTLLGIVTGCALVGVAFLIKYFQVNNGQEFSIANALSDELLLVICTSPLFLAISHYYVASYLTSVAKKIETERDKQILIIERTNKFAFEIGSGHLDTSFEPYDEHDELGKSLLAMRTGIIETVKKEEDRNLIMRAVAETSELLRQHNKINSLGEALIRFLVKQSNAVQSAFYIIKHDEHKQEDIIEMVACYAYNRKKHLTKTFKPGEGLVGQCFLERDIIYRTEIPDTYISITSGLLGDKKPSALIIVPLITNEKVIGILELASLAGFSELHQAFLREISEIIARTIYNLNINETTLRLLDESRRMSAEVDGQRRKLLENAQHMTITQEKLEQTNNQLEEKMLEVNNAHKRLEALLERSSEIISIYEPDGTIRYESPSIKHILGYNPNDLIGRSEKSKVHPDDVNNFEKHFTQTISHPDKSFTLQFRYLKKDGKQVWIESTLTNLLNDPAIRGIIMNSRDISTRIEAEKEQRERAKMQALSENSTDIIMRIDSSYSVRYINPSIHRYTHKNHKEYLKKNIRELEIHEGVKDAINQLLKDAFQKHQKLIREIEFIDADDTLHYMEVNAIPETDENKVIESVLLVMHNITNAKISEKKIQEKNKKITESINYAKRIQGSILPKETLLKEFFPEAFILFIPKDIVSGDFPFIFNNGDWTYVAAVDCTGHGVPGAMLSIIGSLIMSEIVRYENLSASALNDRLHEHVVRILRQGDAGSENKFDGMDIALCKINNKTGALEYSGAHRPLFILRNNIINGVLIEEFKGDKLPIGGVQYKGRKAFTNFETILNENDRLFFFSDGYTDQFGATSPSKKMGSQKVKEVILETCNTPMTQVAKELERNYWDWRGPQKQTDDLLMIGINFNQRN